MLPSSGGVHLGHRAGAAVVGWARLSPWEKLPWHRGGSSDHRPEKILEGKLRQSESNISSITSSLLFLPTLWLPQMDSF